MSYRRFPKELKQYFIIIPEPTRKRIGFKQLENVLVDNRRNDNKEDEKEDQIYKVEAEQLMTEIADQDSDRDEYRDLIFDIQPPRVVNQSVQPRYRFGSFNSQPSSRNYSRNEERKEDYMSEYVYLIIYQYSNQQSYHESNQVEVLQHGPQPRRININVRGDMLVPGAEIDDVPEYGRIKRNIDASIMYNDNEIELNDEEYKLLDQPIGNPIRSMSKAVISHNINSKPPLNQSFYSFQENDCLMPVIMQKDESRSSQVYFYKSKKS
jgi:bifunctional DNA-binding transcriptional regulator/antitoxin component of YhaV-PrlF toxin-antitoxin module